MKYDFKKEKDVQDAREYLELLIKRQNKADLKKINKPKSISQHGYMYACISLFGANFGYSIEEAKTLLKRNCSFMVYEKNGTKFLTSIADLTDTKQATDFIDFIRTYSSKQNYYIPTPTEYRQEKFFYDKIISDNKEHL